MQHICNESVCYKFLQIVEIPLVHFQNDVFMENGASEEDLSEDVSEIVYRKLVMEEEYSP